MKTLWAVVLFIFGSLALPSAKGQEWVMCDSCVSAESASVQTVPNGGERGLAVEPNTPSYGRTSWGPVSGGGSWWLICSTQGGEACWMLR